LKQKFKKGTLVKIQKDLGSYMSNFESDCFAIVEGTYKELCGGDNIQIYSLNILPKCHNVSWYQEHQLIEIPPSKLLKLAFI
jgi:Na+-transporting NADH:ubiquinone oxidoreductase subunit NqrD